MKVFYPAPSVPARDRHRRHRSLEGGRRLLVGGLLTVLFVGLAGCGRERSL